MKPRRWIYWRVFCCFAIAFDVFMAVQGSRQGWALWPLFSGYCVACALFLVYLLVKQARTGSA